MSKPRVLIANRGAVAARVIRALNALGMESVAVFSDADADLPYLAQATKAVRLGPASPRDSYLNQSALLQVALETQCDGIHPGYGFLSENATFARKVEQAGLTFIGPSPKWIEILGDKVRAREFLADHGMPMTPSSQELDSLLQFEDAIRQMGLPVLLKPAGGGGGIGMMPVRQSSEIVVAWERASSVSSKAFGVCGLYAEKLVENPRHIEFQLMADRYGNVKCLYERDCSVQRRRQKVIEESPATNIDRQLLESTARKLEEIMSKIGYDVIGTVEMLYDQPSGLSFLEVNTRLQVEHAVTEEVTGIDIVTSQIRLAFGEKLDDVLAPQVPRVGHAIEARIYAEDPVKFFPSSGVLDTFDFPSIPGVRIETGYARGSRITPHYDPLIAKVISKASERLACIEQLKDALRQTDIQGVKTNIAFVLHTLADADFLNGEYFTDRN